MLSCYTFFFYSPLSIFIPVLLWKCLLIIYDRMLCHEKTLYHLSVSEKRNSQYKSNKGKKSYSSSCWRKGIDLWREMKSTKYVLLGKMRNCRELSLCI